MMLKTGDVVMLKSGGQAMTVADVDADSAVCVWMGEDGDLFRETLPFAVLDGLEIEEDEDEDSDETDDETSKVA